MTQLLSIGAAAEATGLTPRTLRYYEQRGLLFPSAHSTGGARRYTPADLERLARIRSLAELLGADLDRIKKVLDGEDRLEGIRAEYHSDGVTPEREHALLVEALATRQALLAEVDAKVAALQDMRGQLLQRIERLERRLAEADRQPV